MMVGFHPFRITDDMLVLDVVRYLFSMPYRLILSFHKLATSGLEDILQCLTYPIWLHKRLRWTYGCSC